MKQYKVYKIDKDGKETLETFEVLKGTKKVKVSEFYHKQEVEKLIEKQKSGTYLIKEFHIVK